MTTSLLSKDRNHRKALISQLSALSLVLALVLGSQHSALSAQAGTKGARKVTVARQSLYDVVASDTDVRFVLEALARQSGVNLVISPDVTGTITAQLRQKPLEAILDSLSAAKGFDWHKTGDAYIVSAKEQSAGTGTTPPPGPSAAGDNGKTDVTPPAPAPEYEMLIWRCRHIKAGDLVTLLSGMFPSCKVAAGPSSISPTLEQPLGSASVSLGGAGSSSSGSSGSSAATGTSGGGNDKSPTVVLYGDSKDLAKAKTMLEKLDVARPQIAIEVAVTEISSTSNKDVGINWSWNDVTVSESASSGISFGKFTKGAMTFTGTLAALAEHGNARLLAQPNISVVDGGCADILIGDRILFPKLVGYTQFGTPIYDKEEERVGIYLQIAPRITEDDEVLMTLYPQVSLVTSYLKTQAGNYPQISTREARTTVSVKAGTTLAIGGLIKDNDIKNGSKIPLLGDLPIIGQLFRHSKTTKERTEIVIFLTPRIVDIGKG